MGQFALDIKGFIERTKEDADQVCRAIGIEVLTRVVLKSPVGNPELWKSNQGAVYGRQTFNLFVDASNAADAATGSKRKPLRRKGQRALANQFPLRAGKGYVGGSFRRNWQLSIGAAESGIVAGVDPSGRQAISDAQAAISAFKAGPPIHITNNLPYGIPLEFEGHSTQAPAGMVRVTIAEINEIIAKAAAEVKA